MTTAELRTTLWVDQIEAISKFYKEEFGITINWRCIAVPEWTPEKPRLEYRRVSLKGKAIVEKYNARFGDLATNDISEDPDFYIHDQQDDPVEDYVFAWSGSSEPDTEHLDKSYSMYCDDGNKYFTPIEGIIAAYRKRYENGEILDQKGSTFFHALDNDYDVMLMNYTSGKLFISSSDYHDYHEPNSGPRQKIICKKIS